MMKENHQQSKENNNPLAENSNLERSTSTNEQEERSLENVTNKKKEPTTPPPAATRRPLKEEEEQRNKQEQQGKIEGNKPSSASPTKAMNKSIPSNMEFVEKVRNRAKDSLASPSKTLAVHDDFDFTLNCVKGLIKVNDEIWRSCKQFCRSNPVPGSDILMYRISLDKVRVNNYNSDIIITTSPEYCVGSFGCIPMLPKELEQIFPLSCCYRNGYIFPDYGRYLRNLLLLEDGILEVSLLKYQSYLETVQVFLGVIDDWIVRSMEARDMISKLFDKDLSDANVSWNQDYTRWYSESITLCTLPDKTTVDITFDVSSERDRKRLKTYLEFLLL